MTRTRDFDQAVSAKADLVRNWTNPDKAAVYAEALYTINQNQQQEGFPTEGVRDDIARVVAAEQTVLTEASVFYVTADMTALIAAAATVMPKEPTLLSDPPCERGFVYFQTPIVRPEKMAEVAYGRTSTVRALSWGVPTEAELATPSTGRGVLAMTFTDKQEWLANTPPEVHFFARWSGQLVQNVMLAIPTGEEPQLASDWHGGILRIFKAFWAISQQRIAHVMTARPNRALSRRLEKAGLPPTMVKIVTLRRRSNVQPEPTDLHIPVDWSHRWLVSGHWRNQWLPSVGAHRLQWIDEYVKGPEDKPLVVKDTVFRVAR